MTNLLSLYDLNSCTICNMLLVLIVLFSNKTVLNTSSFYNMIFFYFGIFTTWLYLQLDTGAAAREWVHNYTIFSSSILVMHTMTQLSFIHHLCHLPADIPWLQEQNQLRHTCYSLLCTRWLLTKTETLKTALPWHKNPRMLHVWHY